MTENQLAEINKLILELDGWGYSELLLKWRDNKLVKISGTREYKPEIQPEGLTIIKKCATLIVRREKFRQQTKLSKTK